MSTLVSLQNNHQICIQGSVTFDTVAVVQKNVMTLLRNNSSLTDFQLNLKDVSVVNSAALGLLVELKKWVVAQHKTIRFLNLPDRLLSLAQVCGVATLLEIN